MKVRQLIGVTLFAGLVVAAPLEGLAQSPTYYKPPPPYKPPTPYGAAQTRSYDAQANKVLANIKRAGTEAERANDKAEADMAKAQREREAAAARAKAERDRLAATQPAPVVRPTPALPTPAYPGLQPFQPLQPFKPLVPGPIR